MVGSLAPDLCSDPDWSEYWDICLENTVRKEQAGQKRKSSANVQDHGWSKEEYDEEEHNCFAFVLNFLKVLKQNPISSEANNKLEFCRKYVLPKTALAGKYICLYRKIKDSASGNKVQNVYVPNDTYQTPINNHNSDSNNMKR